MELFNSQLELFKVEIKEEANAYARGITMIAVGAVIATVGFALLNVAIAFAVSTLFAQANFSQPASYALGFVVTGAFYVLVGGDRRAADEEPFGQAGSGATENSCRTEKG